jgi:hypothetical protein
VDLPVRRGVSLHVFLDARGVLFRIALDVDRGNGRPLRRCHQQELEILGDRVAVEFDAGRRRLERNQGVLNVHGIVPQVGLQTANILRWPQGKFCGLGLMGDYQDRGAKARAIRENAAALRQ